MKALEGLRILDLTHILSGPYATMMLADLGAEIIKIEPPGRGEPTRKLLADDPDHSIGGMGPYFLSLNRNKKSLTLDLKAAAGREIFHQLCDHADVVIQNFSVGVADRLGISREHLPNPRIITCSITGFGERGPNRDHLAFDLLAQGTGGGMALTGDADSPPTRAGIPIGDLGAGMMAVIGILSAVQARHRTGRGQHIDISMQDCQVSLLTYMATMNLMSGYRPARLGNGHFVHVPYNTYPAGDGWLIVAVVGDEMWARLMEAIDCPALDLPEHRTQAGRHDNREIIERVLGEHFAARERDHWLGILRRARVPCAPVNQLDEALADPHVRARDMVVELTREGGDRYEMPGNPIKLSDAGAETFTWPPALGQHTDELLGELLGKSADQLSALRAQGVI